MDRLKHILMIGLLICCSGLTVCHQAQAYRIALLPVADVTLDRNGVNMAVTEQLITQLRTNGFAVSDTQTVHDYMVVNGLRRCGEIDSFACRKMATQLQVDAILVTTLFGHDKTNDQMSLLCTLLHGDNGQIVWSSTQALHLNDKQPLFGVGATTSISELQTKLLSCVAHDLKQQLPQLPEVNTTELALAQIKDVQISPEVVRGGNPINCEVKLEFIDKAPDSIRLTSGNHAATLQRCNSSNIYVGTIASAEAEGKHHIDLSLCWLKHQVKTINNLCSYTVANEPAQLSLNFRSGLNLGDMYAFSDSIKIAPQMKPQRPIDMWRITILNKNGKKVFAETQYSDLPIEMRWRGNDNNMRRLDNGEYTLSLFTRDIAGNEAAVEAQLYLQNTDKEMVSISQHISNGKCRLELLPAEDLQVPIDNWALTLETQTGVPLFTTKGYQLPASVDIPDDVAQPGLIYQFRALDQLGNHYDVADVRLEAIDSSGMFAQLQSQKNWSVDF